MLPACSSQRKSLPYWEKRYITGIPTFRGYVSVKPAAHCVTHQEEKCVIRTHKHVHTRICTSCPTCTYTFISSWLDAESLSHLSCCDIVCSQHPFSIIYKLRCWRSIIMLMERKLNTILFLAFQSEVASMQTALGNSLPCVVLNKNRALYWVTFNCLF